MAAAKRCDRCGSYFDENNYKWSNSKCVDKVTVVDDRGIYVCKKDLCDECMKKLDKFLNGSEE